MRQLEVVVHCPGGQEVHHATEGSTLVPTTCRSSLRSLRLECAGFVLMASAWLLALSSLRRLSLATCDDWIYFTANLQALAALHELEVQALGMQANAGQLVFEGGACLPPSLTRLILTGMQLGHTPSQASAAACS